MSDSVRFTYIGPAAKAVRLARELDKDGLRATYEQPVERRDAGSALEVVRIVFEVWGAADLVTSAVRKFRARYGDDSKIEGLDDSSDDAEDDGSS